MTQKPGTNLPPRILGPLFHARNVLDFYSGSNLGRFSIFSMGIMPYINACGIMSLLQGVHFVRYLDRLESKGEAGRRAFWQITRYLALFLAALQGFGLTVAISKMPASGRIPVVASPTAIFFLTSILSLIAGTFFIMWLADQITERGIGNGIPLIVLMGIAGRIPRAVGNLYKRVASSELDVLQALFLLAVVAGILYAVIMIQTSPRKIPIQYPGRSAGKKGFISLRMDQSWITAVSFAVSTLAIPIIIIQFTPNAPWAQAIMSF